MAECFCHFHVHPDRHNICLFFYQPKDAVTKHTLRIYHWPTVTLAASIKMKSSTKQQFKQPNRHKSKGSTRNKNPSANISLADLALLKPDTPGFVETEGNEKTFNIKQEEIVKHVSLQSSKKRFDLKLPDGGAYSVDYTQNGRHLLIGGTRGHVAAFDWQSGKIHSELYLDEPVHDITWLHNETFFAVAQQQHVYIYDQSGTEVHRLKKHTRPKILEFLQYHFLLASIGSEGLVRYQDVSTGELVAEWRTNAGMALALRQNPRNAVLHMGHAAGTVTLWSPNIDGALVKMLCHKGPVQSLAVDRAGSLMATAGLDGIVKIWDLRTYLELDRFYPHRPVASLDFSQRGILAAGCGAHVTLWKDVSAKPKSPYLNHLVPSQTVRSVRFCPFDDVLALGHTDGISSLLVPGSGEPNYDSLESNPYTTRKQRQESEVHKLLDKLQPETIVLDPDFIGKITRDSAETIAASKAVEAVANKLSQSGKEKKKMRGKSTAYRRYLRKRANVIDEYKTQQKEQDRIEIIRSHNPANTVRTALDRFMTKAQ